MSKNSTPKTTSIKMSRSGPSSTTDLARPVVLALAALHGFVGEVVSILSPHTEADPAAILIQFLALFGNVVARTVSVRVGHIVQVLVLFICLAGESAKARKGTSWTLVKELFADADGPWLTGRFQGGLASGEGLIYAVRDARNLQGPNGRRYRDPGVADKRLVVFEPEMAGVFRVGRRDGNILLPLLRQAWDGEPLGNLTKNEPSTATDPRITLIGHITVGELRRCLSKSEQSNGFANRFLWVWVKRSRVLALGGSLNEEEMGYLQWQVAERVAAARQLGVIEFGPEAQKLWIEEYPQLSRDREGLSGQATARAEAQVLRLACLYAAIDVASEISVDHLRAALAVWRYCEESAEYLFGEMVGEPVADTILIALRGNANGRTRTEISKLFSGNKPSAEIETALMQLKGLGYARVEATTSKAGRPAERWFAAANPPSGTEAFNG